MDVHKLSKLICVSLLIVSLSLLFLPSSLWAGLRDASFVRGGRVYGRLFVIVFALGIFGFFILLFALTCPKPICEGLLMVGSIIIGLQYIFLIKDLLSYSESFSWYDGFLLAPYLLFLPQSYSNLGVAIIHVLPSLILISSTIAVPVVWRYYLQSSRISSDTQPEIENIQKKKDFDF
jgi:mannose/fructose/N-acetylgalactosamine-specific phosphotransferase system component IIC